MSRFGIKYLLQNKLVKYYSDLSVNLISRSCDHRKVREFLAGYAILFERGELLVQVGPRNLPYLDYVYKIVYSFDVYYFVIEHRTRTTWIHYVRNNRHDGVTINDLPPDVILTEMQKGLRLCFVNTYHLFHYPLFT